MKKLLAMVLALMLALSCIPALGEDVEFVTYTQPILGYTIECPANWYALDSENLASLADILLKDNNMQGIDPSVYENISNVISGTNMTMFLATNGTNMSVGMQDLGLELTNDLFLALMMPQLLTQFQTLYQEIEFLDRGSLYRLNDMEYVRMEAIYQLNGEPVHVAQYYYLEGTKLYLITVTFATELSEEEKIDMLVCMDYMMSTFTPASTAQ